MNSHTNYLTFKWNSFKLNCMTNLFENFNLLLKQINSKTEQKVARILLNNSMTISTAESCTGGLISSRLTDIAGSSAFVKENYVTYANESKTKLLGVSEQTLEKFGAVSEKCALEMVQGLFETTNCDVALATTGIAGPDTSENKNVGLIYIAIKNKYATSVKKIELSPYYKRKTMKFLFSQKALELLIEFLKKNVEQKQAR